jgi:very-short-patch-repair endonuclease
VVGACPRRGDEVVGACTKRGARAAGAVVACTNASLERYRFSVPSAAMPALHNLKPIKQRRKDLRAALTPAEAALWRALQKSQLRGRKFRRQHSVGRYIVDFYCPAEHLVVELDGAAHDSVDASQRDEKREAWLRSVGLQLLRIENRHVFENLEGVLMLIAARFRST